MLTNPLRQVEAMIDAGAEFGLIEDFIENSVRLSDESRAALWLLAWTETSREQRHQCIAEMLQGRVTTSSMS